MIEDALVLMFVDPFVGTLSEYSSILRENDPDGVGKKVPIMKGVFLDFWLKHMMNIEGAICLLPKLRENVYYKIPLTAILRSLTADALTISYLRSFERDEQTFVNEINCLQDEVSITTHKIKEVESGEKREKPVIKKRLEHHRSSSPELLTEKINVDGIKFLTEEMKREHLATRGLLDNATKKVFLFNKLFTMNYHYSVVGGNIARDFGGKEFFFYVESIIYSIEIFIKMVSEQDILSENVIHELTRHFLALKKILEKDE